MQAKTAAHPIRLLAILFLGLVGITLAGSLSYILLADASLQGRIIREVESALTRSYGVEVQVGKVSAAPFGRVDLTDITVRADGDPGLFSVERVAVRLSVVAWIKGRFEPAAAVGEIGLIRPRLTVRRDPDGEWNVSRFAASSGGAGGAFRGRVVVEDGTVNLVGVRPADWGARGDAGMRSITLTGVSGSVSFTPSGAARLTFSGQNSLESATRFHASGTITPVEGGGSSLDARLWLRGVDLAQAVDYLPGSVRVGTVYGGRADIRLDVTRTGARTPVRVAGEASFSGVNWRSPWLDAPVEAATGRVAFTQRDLTIKGLAADFLGTRFHINGRIHSFADPVLDLAVKADDAALAGLSGLIDEASGWGGLDGRVGLETSIKGPWRNPLIEGRVRFAGGHLEVPGLDAPLTGVNGEISVSGRSFTTKGLVARYAGAEVKVDGLLRAYGDPRADLSVSVNGLPVEEARRLAGWAAVDAPLLRSATGRLSLNADIKGPLTSPAVRGNVGLTDGRIDDLVVKGAEARFAYAGGNLTVSDFKGATESGALSGAATIRGLAGTSPDYAFELKFDGVDIDKTLAALHVRTSLPVDGMAHGTLTGHGRGLSPAGLTAGATLQIKDGAIARQEITGMRAALAWERGDVVVDYAVVESAEGEVAAAGRMTAAGELTGSLSGRQLDIGDLVGNLQLAQFWPDLAKAGVSGRVDLSARLGGSLAEPRLTGDVEVANPGYGNTTFRSGEGRFDLVGEVLRLTGLTVRKAETEHRLDGEIRFGKAPTLDLQVVSESAGVGDLLHLAGVKADISGTLDGTFAVTGSLADPTVTGKVDVVRGSVARQPFDRAETTFTFTGGELSVERFTALSGDAEVKGRGVVAGGRLDFVLDASRVDLAELAALQRLEGQISGTASFRGTIKGETADPVVEGEITGSRLAYREYGAKSLAGSLRYTRDTLTLSNVILRRQEEEYVVSGDVRLRPELALDLRARLDKGDIAEFLRLAKINTPYEISGGMTGVLRVWGTPANPSARLMAETAGARFGDVELSGDADIGLANREITINRLRLSQGDGLFVAIGKIGRDQALDLRAHGQDLSLAPWLAALKLPVRASGSARVDLTLSGTVAAPQARAVLRVDGGKMNEIPLDTLTGTAVLSGGKLRLEDLVVASGKHRLTAEGDVPLPPQALSALKLTGDPGRYDLSVRMEQGDFSLLSFAVPFLTMSGPGDVALRITGPYNAPSVTGEVVAKGVKVVHPSLLGAIEDVTGKLEFRGDRAEFSDTKGDYNGGPVTARGQISWANDTPELNLVVSGRNVHYPDPMLDAVVSADLSVKGPWLTPAIEGRGTLEKATLTLGVQRQRRNSPFDPTLNIEVANREDVRVTTRAKSLDVRAYGQLTIRGSLKKPTFTGVAEATRGNLVYLDTPFRITSATADFAAYRGILPRLEALAEAEVESPERRVRITLSVTGVIGALAMNLDSDPPMSQAEINGLLSLPGQISRLVTSDGSGSIETEVARLFDAQLSSQVMGGLQTAVAEALQLDEFKLAQSFAEKNLRMQVGKYLVDDLYMTYARTFGTDPLETLRFEYRLQPGLLVNTSFDNRGDVRWGLEAKHRF